MNAIGFDNLKYVKIQSEHIRERISQFGGKLYLELGGKLFDDHHASRVLPGFKVYDSDALKDYYANGEVQQKNSFAVVPIIGWKGRNLDFGVYYKHYTKKTFFHSLDGHKDLGEDKARVGYHVTYYF